MFNNRKNKSKIRMTTICGEKKQYSPSDEKTDKLTDIFNKLIKRSDYKSFNYHASEIRTPHVKSDEMGRSDKRATHYDIIKTVLYHYAVVSQTATHTEHREQRIVTRIIKKYDGEELTRSFEFAPDILSLQHIPRPDIAKIEAEQKRLHKEKEELAEKKHALFAVRAQAEKERDDAETFLRSRRIPFHVQASTDELKRTVEAIKHIEANEKK
jgi:hypothetical protein